MLSPRLLKVESARLGALRLARLLLPGGNANGSSPSFVGYLLVFPSVFATMTSSSSPEEGSSSVGSAQSWAASWLWFSSADRICTLYTASPRTKCSTRFGSSPCDLCSMPWWQLHHSCTYHLSCLLKPSRAKPFSFDLTQSRSSFQSFFIPGVFLEGSLRSRRSSGGTAMPRIWNTRNGSNHWTS